jgi:type II site-specific deoxyribonuclease
MELNNGEKSKHGINLQNSLEDTLVQLKYKNYIKDYKKVYKIGQQGYANTTQFYAPFHISFLNNEEWILFTTTSLRTNRVKGQQWDTYNIKNINKNIVKALLIYPDGISEKEEKEFQKQQSKYKNKKEVSYIDDIMSHEQFYSLIESIALSTLTVGKQKDIQGKNFEMRVADILSDENNLIRWNKGSGVIDGRHYPIF